MDHLDRRRGRVRTLLAFVATAAIFASPAAVSAQEPAADSLRQELERLRVRIDSLTALVSRLAARGADSVAGPVDELAAIRAAAAEAAAGQPADTARPEPAHPVGGPRSQQVLNPELTVTGDLFAFAERDAPEAGNFVARGFELSLQSALDPYSLAKVFIGYHVPGAELTPFGEAHGHAEEPAGEEEEAHEGGHGGEMAVEEGYIRWSGLGRGLNLTFGRFRQGFGTLNRWHPHALPGQSYPLPYLAFFGEEGLAQTGVRAHWLAPWTGFGTWELWAEVTSSENEVLFGESRRPSALGRVNAFWDLGRSTYVELGASGMAGPAMSGDGWATRVGGVDFAVSWRPPERARYQEATLRGGVVYGQLEPEGSTPDEAWGGFLIGEYKLGQRWSVGGRWEFTENPLDPAESTWLAAPTLTWWQSEWVRLRAELDVLDRPDGRRELLLLQATFAMGPHKHENY